MKWIWNLTEQKIDDFHIGKPFEVSQFPEGLLTRLERYEYEDFDTYLIHDTNHSKLIVKEGVIDTIICCKSLIFMDKDLFTLTIPEIQQLLNQGDWVEYQPQNKILHNNFYPIKIIKSGERIYHILVYKND